MLRYWACDNVTMGIWEYLGQCVIINGNMEIGGFLKLVLLVLWGLEKSETNGVGTPNLSQNQWADGTRWCPQSSSTHPLLTNIPVVNYGALPECEVLFFKRGVRKSLATPKFGWFTTKNYQHWWLFNLDRWSSISFFCGHVHCGGPVL